MTSTSSRRLWQTKHQEPSLLAAALGWLPRSARSRSRRAWSRSRVSSSMSFSAAECAGAARIRAARVGCPVRPIVAALLAAPAFAGASGVVIAFWPILDPKMDFSRILENYGRKLFERDRRCRCGRCRPVFRQPRAARAGSVALARRRNTGFLADPAASLSPSTSF